MVWNNGQGNWYRYLFVEDYVEIMVDKVDHIIVYTENEFGCSISIIDEIFEYNMA